jgi:hypothetical protein
MNVKRRKAENDKELQTGQACPTVEGKKFLYLKLNKPIVTL